MASHLPYTVRTASGDVFDISFPLHRETGSPIRVAQLLTAILETLDREIGLLGETSNGDVLQALVMATAVRSAMIHAPPRIPNRLAADMLVAAQSALAQAERQTPAAGHA